MQATGNSLKTIAANINQGRIRQFNYSTSRLEQVFTRILERGHATIKDSVIATYFVLRVCLFTIESSFLAAAGSALVFSGHVFLSHETDHGMTGLLPSLASVLLIISLPLLVSFITIPIHLIFRVRLSIMTFVHFVLTTLAASLIIPLVLQTVFDIGVVGFSDVVFLMAIIYFIDNLYLLLLLQDSICISNFARRRQSNSYVDLLPPDKRGNLLSMSAQDHYVEITTEKGVHLHRMSLKEAIGRVRAEEGIRVHRSHWVAFAAMRSLDKSAERYTLLLSNGAIIPVSKSYADAVQGFLENRQSQFLNSAKTER